MPLQKSCESVIRRTIQRRTLSLVLGVAWFLLPNSAHAEVPHYRVELSVPTSLSECNREADLLGMIEPMVTGPMLEPPFTRVITMRIAKNQSIYRLELFVKERDGRPIDEVHTELPASMSCFEVLYRGALRAALHMNLNAPDEAKPPAPPPAPPPCPVCETPKPAPKPAKKERRFFVGAGGLVGFGIAPEIVGGMQLLGGWRWSPSWSIEVDGRGTFPTDTRPLGPTIVRVYSVASLAIAPCYRLASFGLCGLVMGTSTFASSLNVEEPQVRSASFLGLGGRGFLEHRFGNRWSFRVDIDIVAPVMRIEIEDAKRQRWAPSAMTGSLGISTFVWF